MINIQYLLQGKLSTHSSLTNELGFLITEVLYFAFSAYRALVDPIRRPLSDPNLIYDLSTIQTQY